jgi:hypothetical protein
MTLDQILQHLSEAIEWCASRAITDEPKNCLRTPAFAPQPFTNQQERSLARQDEKLIPYFPPRLGLAEVEIVCAARRNALLTLAPRSAIGPRRGRLLGYTPDDNLCDGASTVRTDGFFDTDNIPPWDTWIACVAEHGKDDYLLSWIPPEFIDLAEDGINVNPEACIWWFDRRDTAFARTLTNQLRAVN